MNVFRLALVAATIAFSSEMALADAWQDGVTAYNAGDFATALEKWRPLAEQGDAKAQANLGWMYSFGQGQGVPQDYAEAARWYRLAADQGNVAAQFNLGGMYRYGQGVPQDFVTAHMWYNIAAANGDEMAGVLRDIQAERMSPADISDAQARARVCMASSYVDCD